MVQNILVKNSEQHTDIDFLKKTSTDKLVESSQKMVTDLKSHVLLAFVSSN